MESFYIPNFPVTTLIKFASDFSDLSEKDYIKEILQDVDINTMMIFIDGSAQSNPGPTGSGVVIKNLGHHSVPVKLAKAITACGTSYEGEMETMKLVTDCAFKKIGQPKSFYLCRFSFCKIRL